MEQNGETDTVEYVSELTLDQLEELIKGIDQSGDRMLVVKFYADWCGPCKRVTAICDEGFKDMRESAVKVVIDIDDQLDLYMFLKRKRVITGIPCALAWHPNKQRDASLWYIADDCVLSSDTNDTVAFFQRQIDKSHELASK